jgi:signal transduction histidine kinase/ActR/RegA family two-component response regulator
MSEQYSKHPQLRRALSSAGTALSAADPEDFEIVLLETLGRIAEIESLSAVAVLGGSIREGSCAWADGCLDTGWCDELQFALFDEAGDRLSAEGSVLAADDVSAMGTETRKILDKLGCRSLLAIRLGGEDDPEAALVLGSPVVRDWSPELASVLVMLGSIISGVSRRERQESERNAANAELQQSRNLGAISKLSGGIAHDINDMLVPIIGHSEAILASGSADAGMKAILESAKGAADLTKQLLAFSQKQMLVKKPTDLVACVRGLQGTLGRVLGDGIELIHKATESPWCVEVDRGQMDQVLMNLCTNARDAMDGEGPIEVSVDNVTLGQDGAGYVTGNFARMSVRDRGCGVAKECYDQILEPFHTTKGRRGSGLGLSVAQSIVEQHGGWIEIESEIGKGSTFTVYVPAESKERPPERGATRPRAAKLEKARVLLVEDEPSVARFVKQMLTAKGYIVTAVGLREEAFAVLNSAEGQCDLIFSDAMLPDGTGMDVILRARSLSPDVRALLSSGYSDDRSLLARAEAEDVDFLAKPYSLEELISSVENALGAALEA